MDDRYEFALSGEVALPLEVTIAWRYRRANPDFTQWVYGDGDHTLPVHELATKAVSVAAPEVVTPR